MTAPSPIVRTADPAALAEAAAILRRGGLVAFPTETVYGLGADATNDRAVAAIFAAKGRPRFNPLIVHLPDPEAAETHALFDARSRSVAARFWPGPLTLVLPRRADCRVSLLCSAGLDTLALRVPGHPLASALLRDVGRPVAAPSANRSGEVSPTAAAHVRDSLGGRVEMILDGGPCPLGLESTVLDLSQDTPLLLRPGAVTREELDAVVGPLGTPEDTDDDTGDEETARRAPGQLGSHYAPALPLRLNATAVQPGEALLAFGPDAPSGAAEVMNLSPSGDLEKAAANFFAFLRALDRPHFAGIAAMPIPEVGLGVAINDRLRRAAAPRPAADEGRNAP